MSVWNDLRWFAKREFGPDAEADAMDEQLLRRLDYMRTLAGIPMRITSAYRAGDDKAHGRGTAVDVACDNSRDRLRLVGAAVEAGFTRIGVYNLHLHLDVDAELPADVMWIGVSQ